MKILVPEPKGIKRHCDVGGGEGAAYKMLYSLLISWLSVAPFLPELEHMARAEEQKHQWQCSQLHLMTPLKRGLWKLWYPRKGCFH